jgi:hypothetical protein
MAGQAIPPFLRLWRVVALFNTPAFVVGGFAGLTGPRWGAYLLVVNLTVQIGFHLILGAWAYRDVMTRPWPKVAPLDDDWNE